MSAEILPATMRLSMVSPILFLEALLVSSLPSKAILFTLIMAKRVSSLSVYTMCGLPVSLTLPTDIGGSSEEVVSSSVSNLKMFQFAFRLSYE